ncbi:MAG: serine/threonine protein kinase, partial [Verrucomicrobiales bacterium]
MTPPTIPDYTFRALIGEGSTGRVYASEYDGQTVVALKAFDSEVINRQLISDALVKIFNRDAHPGIVEVHDFDLASEQAYMATSLHGEPYQDSQGVESLRPRTIQGLMNHLISEDAWGYVQQIADALAFLHRQRVIHGNLEPANVLLDEAIPPHIKLTDFSQGLVGAVPKLIPGDSVFYAAPEQIRQPEHYFGGRAERWDVYAFGVLAYQLLTGKYPRLQAAITEIKKREAAALDVQFTYDYKVLADMIEKQAAYEWPAPAANEDESAKRAIIDRCLEVRAEDRFPDMREVLFAFEAIDNEKDRREEHRKIAAEQLRRDKEAGSLKKVCAALGLLALSGLGGAAYFSQKGKTADDPKPEVVVTVDTTAKTGVSQAELDEMGTLVAKSIENLSESQGALDEIFALVISRDTDGNPEFDLPEESAGLLLNYYEAFASQHQANPDLALEVAKADRNAGEIHLTLGDGEAALMHLQKAVAKIRSLRLQIPTDVRL